MVTGIISDALLLSMAGASAFAVWCEYRDRRERAATGRSARTARVFIVRDGVLL